MTFTNTQEPEFTVENSSSQESESESEYDSENDSDNDSDYIPANNNDFTSQIF